MIPRLRATGGERSPVKESMKARRKIIFEMSGIDRRKSIRGSAAGASKRLFKFRQIAQSETSALHWRFFQREPQREVKDHSSCGTLGLPEIFGCGFAEGSEAAGVFGAAPGAAVCAGLPEEAGAIGGL